MYLWSLAQRKHIDYTFGHHGGAWSVAYCPSGDFIASGAGDGTINFTRKSGKVPLSRKQHTAPVTGLTYTHDGRHLLSVSHDRTVKCWDAQWCVFRTQLQTHPSWVCCGDVSPDGQLVVAGNDVGGLIASTLNDPTEVWQLQAHGSPVYGVRFLPDGQSLLTIGWDGTARMWEAHTGRERMAYDWGVGKMYCLAISPDGMTAAAGGENGTIVMWDLEE
jgi:WD40 repeat protein